MGVGPLLKFSLKIERFSYRLKNRFCEVSYLRYSNISKWRIFAHVKNAQEKNVCLLDEFICGVQRSLMC